MWINRCGVLAGAGQFGRPDQGIFAYWINAYLRRKESHGECQRYKSRGKTKKKDSDEDAFLENNRKKERDPLFRLNHTDAKLKADLPRLARKTWTIGKKLSGLQDHLSIYIAFNNDSHRTTPKRPQGQRATLGRSPINRANPVDMKYLVQKEPLK